MRKLTVSRSSMGLYGKFGTLKIYVEDHSGNPDIEIKGTPCRLLGTLRSGDTKEFEISEQEVKVFAIMGKTWRNYKYDYRILEAGYEDIYLAGKSSEDRLLGYLFSFDGETPEDARKDLGRYKSIMVGILVGTLIVSLAIGFIVAYSR